MSYHITTAAQATPYQPPGHFDVRCTRLHDAANENGAIILGLSHFLPGGGAEMAKAPVELIYYIVEGEMTVTTDDGAKHILHDGDSIQFSIGQGRACQNTGINTAKMLVIGAKSG